MSPVSAFTPGLHGIERVIALISIFLLTSFGHKACGETPTPAEPWIGVVASFPKSAHTTFFNAFKRSLATVDGAGASPPPKFIYTMGDAEEGKRLVERCKATPPVMMIYLDAASAQAFRAQVAAPAIVIAPGGAPADAGSSAGVTYVVETMPSAALAAQLLDAIKPAPKSLAVAYIQGSASHEKFIADLGILLRKSYPQYPPVMPCPLPSAACNNAAGIQDDVEKALAKMSPGGALLALPGNNTIKFPFVFDQYALQHRHLLIGLGEFNGSGVACHLGVTPEILATTCVEILARAKKGKAQTPRVTITSGQRLTPDHARIGALGFALSLDPARPIPGLSVSGERR